MCYEHSLGMIWGNVEWDGQEKLKSTELTFKLGPEREGGDCNGGRV